MKRKLAAILALVMLLTVAFPASLALAATEDITMTHVLSVDGESDITVASGTIITVVYSLNPTEKAPTVASQNQITFDKDFFDFVEGSNVALQDYITTSLNTNLAGTFMIYFNTGTDVTYRKAKDLGQFQLKVVAKEGTGYVYNTTYSVSDDTTPRPVNYPCEAVNLKVSIGGGDDPEPPVHTHGSGVKQDGQAAQIGVAGFMDYYKCSCGAFFEDEACTTPITDLAAWKAEGGRGYIAPLDPPHEHAGVLVTGQAATEQAAGWKDYYECSCGDLFEDEACTTPIADLAAWKAEGGRGYIAPLEHKHVGVKQNGTPAQEFVPGFMDYYECACGAFFEDEACKTPIADLAAWKAEGGRGYLAPTHKHGNGVLQNGVPAQEGVAGYKDYYKCSCNAYFEDDACTTPIADLAAWKAEGGRGYLAPLEHKHVGVKQNGTPAQEFVPGFKDYYLCSCGAFFEDEACTKPIADLEAWKLDPNGGYLAPTHQHAGVLQNGLPAQEFAAGYKDYYKCSCDNFYEDAACTIAITDLDAWKAVGGNGYLAPTHKHAGVLQNGVPAQEFVPGYKDYYKCSCDNFYEDAACTIAITDLDAWKAEGGRGYLAPTHVHGNGVFQQGLAPEEFVPGYKDYYQCSCGGFFEDEDCTIAITDLDAWKAEGGNGYLAPTHVHNAVLVEGVPATEDEAGYMDYYYCEDCDSYFEDADCTVVIENLGMWKTEGGAGYLEPLGGDEPIDADDDNDNDNDNDDDDDDDPDAPKTGDSRNVGLWLMLAVASAFGLCAVNMFFKKEEE